MITACRSLPRRESTAAWSEKDGARMLSGILLDGDGEYGVLFVKPIEYFDATVVPNIDCQRRSAFTAADMLSGDFIV